MIGLVRADGRVIMEDGSLLRRPGLAQEGTALFAVRRLNDPDAEIYWHGGVRVTAYLDGRTIRYLHELFRDTVRLPSLVEILEGLILWRDWLARHAVPVTTGMGKIASKLWHETSVGRSLPRIDDAPYPPFLGGRLIRPAKFYIDDGESWLWDITGAYAWSASVCEYPEDGWEKMGEWSGDPLAYVYARVTVPPLGEPQPGTLPEPRPIPHGAPFDFDTEQERKRFSWTASVFLPGRELAAILPLLPHYEILGSWEPRGKVYRLVRGAWREAIEEGRALPNDVARRLAKRTGNSLWGSLAAQGRYKRVDYRKGTYHVSGKLRARSEAVAGLIVSAVRARVFSEAFTVAPVIVGHTDSAIMPAGYSPDGARGELGGWKLKEKLWNLQAFGLNTRRYKLSPRPGEPWIYVAAGERGERAERIFGSKLRRWIDPDAENPPIADRRNGRHRFR